MPLPEWLQSECLITNAIKSELKEQKHNDIAGFGFKFVEYLIVR